MKKLMSILLTLALLVTSVTAFGEAGTVVATPSYLTPSVFVSNYNAMIDMMAQIYADQLGEEGVIILNDEYTMTQVDEQGTLLYYGTAKWDIEAGFAYPDGTEPTDDTPAQVLNFAIKAGTPDGAAEIAAYIFKMMIAYEYQDETLLTKLNDWFATVDDSSNTVELPGYTLNFFSIDGNKQYAILPTDAAYKESVVEKLEQQEPEPDSVPGKDADSGLVAIHCEEDGFSTKVPANNGTEYRTTKGQMGFTVYFGDAGSVPCIIIHRRPIDGKFKNPENYLNNTYREFLENKYEEGGGSVGTNPAKTWEVGGKQLIGAQYFIRTGNNIALTQISLIDIRDQGDVEYIALYRNETEEKQVMDALNAAVANYAED